MLVSRHLTRSGSEGDSTVEGRGTQWYARFTEFWEIHVHLH